VVHDSLHVKTDKTNFIDPNIETTKTKHFISIKTLENQMYNHLNNENRPEQYISPKRILNKQCISIHVINQSNTTRHRMRWCCVKKNHRKLNIGSLARGPDELFQNIIRHHLSEAD
jgi:hypothetical protein